MGEIIHNLNLYKISFERIDDGATAYFFVNGVEDLLNQEYFNVKIMDAKTKETFTVKERIIQQLEQLKKPLQ